MDLYLMQHGVAVAEEVDPRRPLTAEGRSAVERVALRARESGVRIDRCLHSGKVRAEQTARILATAVGIPDVEARAGLGPSDPVAPFAHWIAQEARSTPDAAIAVVGHLPFLDRLAALLVAGDERAQAVHFQNAGLVRLVPKRDADGYAVAWVLVPDLA